MTDRPSAPADADRRLRVVCTCAPAVPIAEDPWVAIVNQRRLDDGTNELILKVLPSR